jgi:hypothetical protein
MRARHVIGPVRRRFRTAKNVSQPPIADRVILDTESQFLTNGGVLAWSSLITPGSTVPVRVEETGSVSTPLTSI